VLISDKKHYLYGHTPPYLQPNLRPDLPLEIINSKFYQNIIEIFSRTAFLIVRTKCYPNSRYWENGKTIYSKPLDLLGVHSASFRFPACDQFDLRRAVQNYILSVSRWHCTVIRCACVVPHTTISIRCIYYCSQRPLLCAVRDRWR